mmetsp:Transcript_58464/g.181560  ORF Transcript_58464/g.181560 Transcript_58464/m.181560 type:complete len:396 (+) Transcript_58464:108-1295(+)
MQARPSASMHARVHARTAWLVWPPCLASRHDDEAAAAQGEDAPATGGGAPKAEVRGVAPRSPVLADLCRPCRTHRGLAASDGQLRLLGQALLLDGLALVERQLLVLGGELDLHDAGDGGEHQQHAHPEEGAAPHAAQLLEGDLGVHDLYQDPKREGQRDDGFCRAHGEGEVQAVDLHHAQDARDGGGDIYLPMDPCVSSAEEQHGHALPEGQRVACHDAGQQGPEDPAGHQTRGAEHREAPRRAEEGRTCQCGQQKVDLREIACNGGGGLVMDSFCLRYGEDDHDHARNGASQGEHLEPLHALAEEDPSEKAQEDQGGRTEGAEHGLRGPGHGDKVQDLAGEVDGEAKDPPRLEVERASTPTTLPQVRVLLEHQPERYEEAAGRANQHAREPHGL